MGKQKKIKEEESPIVEFFMRCRDWLQGWTPTDRESISITIITALGGKIEITKSAKTIAQAQKLIEREVGGDEQ